MKIFFTYLAMILLMILIYKFNIFALIAHKGVLIVGIILVIAIFAIAIRILGNPLARKDNSDEDNK